MWIKGQRPASETVESYTVVFTSRTITSEEGEKLIEYTRDLRCNLGPFGVGREPNNGESRRKLGILIKKKTSINLINTFTLKFAAI